MLMNQFLLLAAVLFAIGVYGVLVRRNGVLVLMPLPKHLDGEAVRRALSPEKDVDGSGPSEARGATRALRHGSECQIAAGS